MRTTVSTGSLLDISDAFPIVPSITVQTRTPCRKEVSFKGSGGKERQNKKAEPRREREKRWADRRRSLQQGEGGPSKGWEDDLRGRLTSECTRKSAIVSAQRELDPYHISAQPWFSWKEIARSTPSRLPSRGSFHTINDSIRRKKQQLSQ